MIAALEAWRGGSDVAIIDKGAIGLGTNSALSAGIFAGPTSHYPPEQYIRDTLQTGRGINCKLRVRLTAKEAPRAFTFLRSLGLELIELSGCYAISSLQGDLIPGITLVKALTKEIKNRVQRARF